jgi:hypothetical protein
VSTRIERTKQVMRAVGGRNEPVKLMKLDDGSSPLIVALPSDYISRVIGQVHRVGGSANVIVAYPNHFELLALQDGAPTQGELIISHDLSMGMLSIRLQANPGKRVRLRFEDTDIEVPQFELEMQYA